MTRTPLLFLLATCLFVVGCASGPRPQVQSVDLPPVQIGPTIQAKHGMVVSVCPIASAAGTKVLRDGGNAVDAAIATAFALAVTWPEAGNIGGGGFMMVAVPARDKPLDVQFIDYRETAPAAVKADTFASNPSQHLLAGTPGTVAGLYLAYEKYGSKRITWNQLVLPAAKLAADGFEVNTALATSLNSGLRNAEAFPEFRRVYGKADATAWKAGDQLKLPELATTLSAIATNGPAEFYEGETAKRIAAESASGGGLISIDDLRRYAAKVRQPIVGSFKGHTIYAPPPPSSGGIAMLQMLNMFETRNIEPDQRWAAGTVHFMVESMRRAFADRARYLGDPDFGTIPVNKLVDKAYAKDLSADIHPAKATSSDDLAKWAQLSETGGQTTHFSVVDRNGMAVSNTYTLEQSFGGKVVVRGAGFLLNNELGDFNPKPGQTTRKGQIGTPPNIAAANKRPLSSMTPTIIAKDGKVVLVTGSPGGRTIINTVTQVVLNRLAFGMTLRQAVDAPRLHHQWQPDVIRIEASVPREHPQTVEALRAMGHHFDPRHASRQGDAHSIEIDLKTGERNGVADQRIGGAAAGY